MTLTNIYILSAILLCGLFILNFTIWTDRYFVHFPLKRAVLWGEGYTKLVSSLDLNKNFDVKEIVMTRSDYSPYIYFLFYNRVDPLRFQNSVVRYKETDEGFQHVAKFDNYSFRKIDWELGDLAIPNRLYIDWTGEVPSIATKSSILVTKNIYNQLIDSGKDISDIQIGDLIISKKVAEIKLGNNESMFTLIKTTKNN